MGKITIHFMIERSEMNAERGAARSPSPSNTHNGSYQDSTCAYLKEKKIEKRKREEGKKVDSFFDTTLSSVRRHAILAHPKQFVRLPRSVAQRARIFRYAG